MGCLEEPTPSITCSEPLPRALQSCLGPQQAQPEAAGPPFLPVHQLLLLAPSLQGPQGDPLSLSPPALCPLPLPRNTRLPSDESPHEHGCIVCVCVCVCRGQRQRDRESWSWWPTPALTRAGESAETGKRRPRANCSLHPPLLFSGCPSLGPVSSISPAAPTQPTPCSPCPALRASVQEPPGD